MDKTQFCKHPGRDYTVRVQDEMQEVCESCSLEIMGRKPKLDKEKTVKKTVDAPPTLSVPPAKKEKVIRKELKKPDFKAIKEKAKDERPAAKLTIGISRDGKYEFVKKSFDSVKDAMAELRAVVEAKTGKGLHEVILSIKG